MSDVRAGKVIVAAFQQEMGADRAAQIITDMLVYKANPEMWDGVLVDLEDDTLMALARSQADQVAAMVAELERTIRRLEGQG